MCKLDRQCYSDVIGTCAGMSKREGGGKIAGALTSAALELPAHSRFWSVLPQPAMLGADTCRSSKSCLVKALVMISQWR